MSLRITPVAVLAAGIAVLVAWALRAHAEFLPVGRVAPHLSAQMSSSASHGHTGGAAVYEPPPPVTGEALANYAGLAMVAVHVLLIGVALAACGVRRWFYPPAGGTPGLLPRVAFAGTVAVAAALCTVAMAVVLLGSAITFPATFAAAVTVLQYAFVFAIVSPAVLGMP